ncbi:hypothetical protein MUP77_06205 [Candidatus Bathyarchaeota archaeon]|nr:hypothetical protein [Candidatus Bathyarchaeota archaeon]
MTEDDTKKWTKFALSTIKTISSTLIDIELSEQEKLAQGERRFDDLMLIRLGQSIKKHADFALDNWIVNL